MKPREKAPELEEFLNDLFGTNRRQFIQNNQCVSCGGVADEFRSEIAEREFSISGLCQSCQDLVFGP